MALPASGLITLAQIGFEAGITQPYTLTKLYGKMGAPASGLIRLSDFYGKSNAFTLNIATSVASPAIHALAIAAGWNGTGPLIVNFNCPYVNSLRLDGSKTFAGGLVLNIASGCLIGGVINGGTAIYTRVPVTIYNNGTIAGGGGKGGTGNSTYVRYSTDPQFVVGGGGQGGSGQGFNTTSTLVIGGAGYGFSGSTSTYIGDVIGVSPWASGGTGGDGGTWGVAGGVGRSNGSVGGNYSASGEYSPVTAGGLAGLYIDGNSQVSWGNKGTINGNFS